MVESDHLQSHFLSGTRGREAGNKTGFLFSMCHGLFPSREVQKDLEFCLADRDFEK